MKIEGNKFYVVDSGNDKWIFTKEEDAVNQLKEESKKNIDPEKVKILEIEVVGDKWNIKQMPWSKIALKILKGS